MFKRLMIVITILLSVVFVPYFIGMIPIIAQYNLPYFLLMVDCAGYACSLYLIIYLIWYYIKHG
jgi:heme A synthase